MDVTKLSEIARDFLVDSDYKPAGVLCPVCKTPWHMVDNAEDVIKYVLEHFVLHNLEANDGHPGTISHRT